jgi:transposase
VGQSRSLAPEMVRLSIPSLLFDPSLVRVRHVKLDGQAVAVLVESVGASACCPRCGRSSPRVHSRYVRHLADVPWHGRSVQLHLKVRRFFCVVADCPRRIFAERLPTVAPTYARTTLRLREAHCTIAFALGGEAGARLAIRLAMPTSPDTLLRRIRSAPTEGMPVPRILGIDDWAFRKGTRYGTILCDLERQRVVDLLPDRQADTLARWLKDRPDITVISRDRAGPYAVGARQGAPEAVQVADRWHLLVNVREALERLLDRKPSQRQAAAQQAAAEIAPPPVHLPEPMPVPVDSGKISPRERLRDTRRQQRVERYERVLELHRQGMGVRQIARELHVSRRTVRRFLRVPAFPERATRQRMPSQLDRFSDELRQRWDEGCQNAAQLHRELRDRGSRCSYATVQRCLERLGCARTKKQRDRAERKAAAKPPVPSPRRASFWLLHPRPELAEEAQRFVGHLCRQDPEIATAVDRARTFAALVREHRPEGLSDWLVQSEQSVIPEIRSLAGSLRQDEAAVRAALELPWSTGPVEGYVNRLKTIKRQMYGRANFDLLRLRVLHAG